MRILVTNDDGINSIGLHVLGRALKPFGEVVVAAPDREYSGASASVGPLPLTTEKHPFVIDGIDEAWAVLGPPALIVLLAGLGGLGEPFDLVVSGINPGANVGNRVYLSGTVGAAILARVDGITGVAIGQESQKSQLGQFPTNAVSGQKWDTAAHIGALVVSSLKENPLPQPGVLNINVPNTGIPDIKGWIRTEIGENFPADRSVTVKPVVGKDRSYQLIITNGDRVPQLPKEIDAGAVANGYVSITWLNKFRQEESPFGESVESALDAHFKF